MQTSVETSRLLKVLAFPYIIQFTYINVNLLKVELILNYSVFKAYALLLTLLIFSVCVAPG